MNITGTDGTDRINGTKDFDIINAGGGNDYVFLSAGPDQVDLGSGDDSALAYTNLFLDDFGYPVDGGRIDGGSGYDSFVLVLRPVNGVNPRVDVDTKANTDGSITIYYGPKLSSLTLINFEYYSFNPIYRTGLFSSGNDTVDFNNLTQTQVIKITSEPSEVYYGLSGDDSVTLPDDSHVVVNGQPIWDGSKLFDAGAGDDTVVGSNLDDKVQGGAGGDTLSGGAGNDYLLGGVGDDILHGQWVNPIAELDFLDGGGGSDTFLVNAGDHISAFESDDNQIVFFTGREVGRIVLIRDSGLQIRAYAADGTYEPIFIDEARTIDSLSVETYSGLGTGVVVRNTSGHPKAFGFAIDDAAAEDFAGKKVQELISAALPELFYKLREEVTDEAFEEATIAFAAHRAGAITANQLGEVFKKYDILGKVVDLSEGYANLLTNDLNGKYDDGKYHLLAQDLGKVISDAILPGGATLFGLGTEIVADIITRVVFSLNSSILVTLDQLDANRAKPPSDIADLLMVIPNETFSAGGGDDTIIMRGDPAVPKGNPILGSFQSSGQSLVESPTYDGGEGIDTLVLSVGSPVLVDLKAAIAKIDSAAAATVHSIENVSGGRSHDILTGDDGNNVMRGNGGDDRLIGGLGDDLLIGGSGLDTAVINALFGQSDLLPVFRPLIT